ncbi:alanine dehydrogenase [Streptomyces sp. NPDC005244]|uniref:alanine dehydrogenase n=1 Tax=Streptomyces sp. NPDC005244 TaxID=3364708 RepID=UPI0036A26015
MPNLTVGVVATSLKQNEQRLTIHPRHIASLAPEVRAQLYFERGYGAAFGVSDQDIEQLGAGLRTRAQLFAECDVILLFKPVLADFLNLREGQILWGCPHFVQDEKVTQASIDQRLTVIAMEGMMHWPDTDAFPVSICPEMGEMAGYSSVTHALAEVGRTGRWGEPLRAAVIGYGSTGQGAVAALRAQGITDITVLTQRAPDTVADLPEGVSTGQIVPGTTPHDPITVVSAPQQGALPVLLAEFDVIVNCIRQKTDAPLMFLTDEQAQNLKAGTLVIDVSCDHAMGFEWASPTTFDEPLRDIAGKVRYYAVDHSPSYLWNSATWILSEAITPYLATIVRGEKAWADDPTVDRAVEVRAGVVENPQILSYQGRTSDYPHPIVN